MDFRELMLSKKMGPYKLEKLTGIRHDKIQRYANGKMYPSLKNILKIAKALGCTPDEVFNAFVETYKRTSQHSV